jgi:hypothetical protein
MAHVRQAGIRQSSFEPQVHDLTVRQMLVSKPRNASGRCLFQRLYHLRDKLFDMLEKPPLTPLPACGQFILHWQVHSQGIYTVPVTDTRRTTACPQLIDRLCA